MVRVWGYRRPEAALALGPILVLAFVLTPFAVAQQFRGTVSGTVTDGTEAVLVGAKVTIKNQDTTISQEMRTNDAGVYKFAAVEPGNYSLEFTYSGFKDQKYENIKVG